MKKSLIALLAAVLGLSAFADIYKDEYNINWTCLFSTKTPMKATIGNGTSTAISPTTATSVIVPSAVGRSGTTETFAVTNIANSAFMSCTSLESVRVPGSILRIGTRAFGGCTSLTDVELSDGLTTIAQLAFDGCTSLRGLYLPPSVTFVGVDLFHGCTALEVVLAPTTLSEAMKERLAAYNPLYYGEGEAVTVDEDGAFVVADAATRAKVLLAAPNATVRGGGAEGLVFDTSERPTITGFAYTPPCAVSLTFTARVASGSAEAVDAGKVGLVHATSLSALANGGATTNAVSTATGEADGSGAARVTVTADVPDGDAPCRFFRVLLRD